MVEIPHGKLSKRPAQSRTRHVPAPDAPDTMLSLPSRTKLFALLAAIALIAGIAGIALYGNRQPALVQLVHSCHERVCGEYALLDCDAAGGGSLYVYARADRRFLADCDTSNAARFTSQPVCSKVFETLKACPANKPP
jgi:hypothetical protein